MSQNFTSSGTREIPLQYTRVSFSGLLKAVIALVILGVLLVLAESTYPTLRFLARLAVALLGPLLAFLFYNLLLYALYKDIFKVPGNSRIILYGYISGLIAILFAITLNSRAIILALPAQLAVGQIGILLFYAVIAPVIEEIAKALPIYFMSRGLTTRRGKDTESRVFMDARYPVMMGFISGSIFNLLETYWYTWNTSYIFLVGNDTYWQLIVGQVLIRSLNPLHLLTASITGFGVAMTFWATPRLLPLLSDYKAAFLGIVTAVFLHGLWNGSLTLPFTPVAITLYGIQLPLFNVMYILAIFVTLPTLLYYVNRLNRTTCTECDQWHRPLREGETHLGSIIVKPSLWQRLRYRSRLALPMCKVCKNRITGAFCTVCHTTNVFACKNCDAPIPVYETQCWQCNHPIKPVYDDVMFFQESMWTKVSKGMLYILAGFYIMSSIATLVLLLFNQVGLNSDFQAIRMILFLLLGLSLVYGVYWTMHEETQALGIAIARTLLSVILVEFAILLLFLSILFFYVGMILFALPFGIEAIIIFVMAGYNIMSYHPLIHLEG